jgi:tagatose kinase
MTLVAVGEILAEILATKRGQSFRAPGALLGPYPSGAPAIFIDQVAKLGEPCGMIGSVGDDDFGRLNVDRLRADGVDVSAIAIHADAPTGTAFVTYQDNGERHFVFNIRHSASGHLTINEAAERLLSHCDHLHIMGSSLFSPRLVEAARIAIDRVKARGGAVSFDPNIRRELAKDGELAIFFDFVLDHCDLLMPSGDELQSLTGSSNEQEAINSLLARGVDAIVVKRGAQGASYHDRAGAKYSPAFPVEELDPTGAGDCFGATFIVCRRRGKTVAESLRYANASGARMVTVKGPMEGVSSFAELDAWLAERPSR